MDANKDELRRSLRSQQTQLALQRALIAPIRRICDDIIHEIFLWVVPQVTEVFDDPSYQYRLAATCQKWREIALSTPFLWTCLALFSPKGTSRTENACSRLQTLIARVGSCQVDIDWFRSARDDRAGSITIAATNYLLSSVPFSRWKSLRINNYDAVDPWSPSTLDGRYGQFEALEFLWLTAGSGCDKLVTQIASFEPPNLRHLKIDTLDDIVHQKYARFGHSLLILDLSGPDFENYGVLNSLQALSLEELPRAALQLPQLKRLSLQTAHVSRLEKSVTPLIESLSIERLVLPKHDQCVLAPTIKDLEVSAHCLHDLLDFVTPNIDRFLVRKTKLTAAEVAVQVKPFSEGDLACQPKILAIAVSLSLKDTLAILEHQRDVVDLTLTFDSKFSWKVRFPSALCERLDKGKYKHKDGDVSDFKLCPKLRVLTVILHPSQSDRNIGHISRGKYLRQEGNRESGRLWE